MALSLAIFENSLGNALRHMVWILVLSYAGTEFGLDDHCGSFTTQDILQFYEGLTAISLSTSKHRGYNASGATELQMSSLLK